MELASFELAPLFRAVEEALQNSREAFNQADTYNGNHGDHMVEIFAVATRAAQEQGSDDMAQAMDLAAGLLHELPENGSARLYASGLAQFAQQFRNYGITLPELVLYVQGLLGEKKEGQVSDSPAKGGSVLKALITGLAGWQASASDKPAPANPLDIGYMFDLGIAYMQAKQRNETKIATLADAAATISPLSAVPHRCQSGKLAIQALLQAML